jgi:tRNA1Val (adenine37-N6)-methyltransferase
MCHSYDSIIRKEISICQPEKGFRYTSDSVFLSDFVKYRKNRKVIDIGSGSGVISVLLACLKGFEDIDALEIQEKMFVCLQKTVRASSLEGIVRPVFGDVREYKPDVRYDIAVCNPPYREPGTGKVPEDYSERISRFNDTMKLADLFGFCRSYLKDGGSLYICIDSDMLADVFYEGRNFKMEPKRLRMVHSYNDAPARMALVELRKGSKRELLTEPPLILKEKDGRNTDEVRRIFGEI